MASSLKEKELRRLWEDSIDSSDTALGSEVRALVKEIETLKKHNEALQRTVRDLELKTEQDWKTKVSMSHKISGLAEGLRNLAEHFDSREARYAFEVLKSFGMEAGVEVTFSIEQPEHLVVPPIEDMDITLGKTQFKILSAFMELTKRYMTTFLTPSRIYRGLADDDPIALSYISQVCRDLQKKGLIESIGGSMYRITNKGELYLSMRQLEQEDDDVSHSKNNSH